MSQFHETQVGQKFYTIHIPALIQSIIKLTEAIEAQNKMMKDQIILEKRKVNFGIKESIKSSENLKTIDNKES